ncbi:MAG TPA: IS110 family transposase [Pyrinomonadaceae bacterium]
MTEYAALIGIDWADSKHDICLIDPQTLRREASLLHHSAKSIDEWAAALRARFGGRPIAICLEQSRGPLIYALLKYDFLTLYPVNPSTLSRYREAFSPSRHKDDSTDAAYLAELLAHHREHLRAWQPDDERARTLRYLVEHRRRLVSDRTRISNRLTSLLKCYFPQILDWFPDIRTRLVCDFLLRWPELSALKRVRPETLSKFFREHNSARRETIERRVGAIKEAVPLVTDRAVIASSTLMVKALASQMQATLAAIHQFDAEIAALCAANEDFALMRSLPGAGQNYAARLTVALGTDRERWQSADELAQLAGIAPVIERSGKSCRVRWRYFCPKFLRQSFHEYAGESVRHSFWARAYYDGQRAKGKSHQAATRALAFKWIRIIYRCWQTRTPYDEVKYLESLRKKGSSLLNYAAQNPA